MAKPAYRRVIVKVSGEAFAGPNDFGIHAADHRAHRRGSGRGARARRHDRRRGRRRQHHPRRRSPRKMAVAPDRRRDGHAGRR